MWREGLEENDELARAVHAANRQSVDEFIKDEPELSKLIYWDHFLFVASILGRFGIVNPDGSKAVYAMCSHIRHSCRPNAALVTTQRGFPRGKQVLHVIGLDGIDRGEEITVSSVDEGVLTLPGARRGVQVLAKTGLVCTCPRCAESVGTVARDNRITALISELRTALAMQPPTDDSTEEARQCIHELDNSLPFSMQLKAKAKLLLAAARGELMQYAAWRPEETVAASVVQWTGLDSKEQREILLDTKQLYDTAAKDFECLLGQGAASILKRLEASYRPIRDQHKMLVRYARERDSEQRSCEDFANHKKAAGPIHQLHPTSLKLPPKALPPSWDELFGSRTPVRY